MKKNFDIVTSEKAILIGVKLQNTTSEQVDESMQELEELASTAGAEVVDIIVQNRQKIDVATYIGKGKLEEIQEFYQNDDIQLIIFNNNLSPAQSRNIEEVLNTRIITRTELILDIFAIHAKTNIAKFQVELAQLQYRLPRLTGQGISMSRTGGGIGTRGPGEQKLETDRRYLNKRIHFIRTKLKDIEKVKQTQRKQRKGEFKVAIVGYTNSGKSTLLNCLVKADILTEDKLFATLDTTTRKLWLGDGVQILITDTVGFISNIPHSLVESFKSTLEDTIHSDLLVHLVDISSPNFLNKIKVVENTITEIGCDEIPLLMCFNKIDAISAEEMLEVRQNFPNAIYLSAKKNTYIDVFKDEIKKIASKPQNK